MIKIFGTTYLEPFEILLTFNGYDEGDIITSFDNHTVIVTGKVQDNDGVTTYKVGEIITVYDNIISVEHFKFLRKYNLTGWAII